MGVAPGGASSWAGTKIFTLGHGARTQDELVELLRHFGVAVLADIRTIPRSRRNPQFDREVLGGALRARGLHYAHLPRLGGLRRARKDSPNRGWQSESFQGYADYMMSEDFEEGLEELRALTTKGTVALMCAEAVPWRCHRSLVADVLTARGGHVEHVTGTASRTSRARAHRMTPFARIDGARLTYPPPAGEASGEVDEMESGLRLAVRPPFHLEATARVLQRRPANLVERWIDDHYLRVLRTPDGLVLVEVDNRGTIDEPDVRYAVRHGSPSASLAPTLRKVLGLDLDPAPLQVRAEAEPRLRATALALRGMRPPRFAGWFETFANVVPFQQVSLEAGVAITSRLIEAFGEQLEVDGRWFHAFPTAGSIGEARLDALRKCGLSTRKAESLRYLARAVASKKLVEEAIAAMTTAEALRALSELPGIGPWSASLVLLRGLGRLDVFPPGDAGVARGLGALLGVSSAASLGRVVERFGDRRGYLYFCALGSALLGKGLIHAAPARRR